LNTGGRFADREAVMAHVALAHNPPLGRKLWNFVGTLHHAIAATDALVAEMADNAGNGVFVVSQNRATFQTGRFNAMMTRGGHGLLKRDDAVASRSLPLQPLTKQRADFAPGFVVIQSVQGMAGADARFAAGTFVEVHFKGVLFAGPGCAERDEVAVMCLQQRRLVALVNLAELFDGGECPLFGQQRINQRFWRFEQSHFLLLKIALIMAGRIS
jgi:hypothetical protein